MSRGINKVILIGNLGNAPEINMTASGAVVATISVATAESYKDKNTGQLVPKTEWHRVVAFQRLAEIMRDYLKKGSKVYIEGRLQTRKWQDQSGQDRYTTEIVANELQMLDSKDQSSNGLNNQAQQTSVQQPQYAPQPSPHAQNPQNYAQNQAANYQQNNMPRDDFDQDIPF